MSHKVSIIAFLAILISPLHASAKSAWYDNITLEAGLTTVVQNSIGNDYTIPATTGADGEEIPSTELKDQIDFAFTADLMVIAKLSETEEMVFHLEAGSGHSMSDNIPSRSAINYDAYDTEEGDQTRVNMSQAYYQVAKADEVFTFAVGLMDVHSLTDTNEFAGDETSQFLNGLFVRSTGVVFHEMPKYYAPTVYLQVKPIPFISLTLTYSSPDGNDIFEKKEIVGQVGLHPAINERKGNYLFGFILHDGDFTKIIDDTVATNTGIFTSIDQEVTDMIGFFFRYSQQDDTLLQNEVLAATSFGISLNNLLGNEGNSVGVGYGFIEFNPNLITTLDEGEDVIEVYVRFGAGENTTVTADLQVFNNLERDDKRSVMAGGLRLQVGL
ncbi:MAG: carbohydrate porin [Nitrospinota bacterium]|nr:carbohydrate porin [Nitrospinota bacterium]